jgi:hypothetical protein
MSTPRSATLWIVLLTGAATAWSQTPLGTAFTYQGQLNQAGQPFEGPADLLFELYDASVGGDLLGGEALNGVAVNGGLFTVQLNAAGEFGPSAFTGEQRWLQISVNGTALSPRQELTATPYAAFAARPWITSGNGISYSAGNVGVGTAAPAAPLEVAGTVRMTGFELPTGATAGYVLTADGSGVGTWQLPTGSAVWSASGVDIYNNNTGSVGIGTAAPASKLDIAATGEGAELLRLSTERPWVFRQTLSGASAGLELLSTVGLKEFHITAAGGANVATFVADDANPRVGIGTTEPTATLESYTSSPTGVAVRGYATAPSGTNYGVYGQSDNDFGGHGVHGVATAVIGGYGVYGQAGGVNGYGVYASGNLGASGTKAFRIDHPSDPQNKYLLHYCSEGPEPQNVYNGTVRTDASGFARVELPDYFEEINRDFRYQLTVVDDSDDFVMAKVTREIAGNEFQVRTSQPHVKVCWEVKAVRNDLYVRIAGAPVEVEKSEGERGKYQHPELYGQPPEMGINYRSELEHTARASRPARPAATPR